MIVAHFNIQVDNPMCMLNQDIAKNFLNTKSTKEKYNVRLDNSHHEMFVVLKFFLKATQLQKMYEDLQENAVEVRNARALLSDHIKVRSSMISRRSPTSIVSETKRPRNSMGRNRWAIKIR